MSLKEAIVKKLKQSMIEKKSVEVTALRQIKTEITKFETSGAQQKATDEDVTKILNVLAKQHQESIDIYKANNRNDLLEKEEEELVLIKSFLPQEISAEDLEVIVNDAISETGAESKKDMGKVMQAAKKKVNESGLMVDGKSLSEKVKSKLN